MESFKTPKLDKYNPPWKTPIPQFNKQLIIRVYEIQFPVAYATKNLLSITCYAHQFIGICEIHIHGGDKCSKKPQNYQSVFKALFKWFLALYPSLPVMQAMYRISWLCKQDYCTCSSPFTWEICANSSVQSHTGACPNQVSPAKDPPQKMMLEDQTVRIRAIQRVCKELPIQRAPRVNSAVGLQATGCLCQYIRTSVLAGITRKTWRTVLTCFKWALAPCSQY